MTPDAPAPVDVINGGCNLATPLFTSISCGETVCGESFFQDPSTGSSKRDTDWYLLHLDFAADMTWTVTAEFVVLLGIMDEDDGVCKPTTDFFHFDVVPACSPGVIRECLAPGTYMLFVAPNFSANNAIGETWSCRQYIATVSCTSSCAIACCEEGNCVETDAFDCVFGRGGNSWGNDSDCADPLICVNGCSLATPTPIACGDSITIDNLTNATLPSPFFSCADGADHIGAEWIQFTAMEDTARIYTCSANNRNSTLALYSGNCSTGSLIEVACSEDDCPGGGSPISLAMADMCVGGLTVGETYFIQLAAHDPAALGHHGLTVECPCDALVVPGACCLPDFSCLDMPSIPCSNAGGQWRGGGFTCANGACLDGACCDPAGGCAETLREFCLAIPGARYLGNSRSCTANQGFTENPCDGACCGEAPPFDCTTTNTTSCSGIWYEDQLCEANFWTCPEELCSAINVSGKCQAPSLDLSIPWYSGKPIPVARTIASSSDMNSIFEDPANPGVGTGQAAMDDFTPLGSPISEVCWWGMYADLNTSAVDQGRCQVDDVFTITFFQDDGNGCPVGPAIASEAISVVRAVATAGVRVTENFNLVYQHNAMITPVVVVPGQCYWLAITSNTSDGRGTQTCRWMWVTAMAAEGNWRSLSTFTNDPTVPPDCTDAATRKIWDYSFCLDVANEPCDFCGLGFCTGTPEGEPICTNGYTDSTNDGCDAGSGGTNFTTINCNESICGSSGNYDDLFTFGYRDFCLIDDWCTNGETCLWYLVCSGVENAKRDTDWYSFDIAWSDVYDWKVQAAFPYFTGVLDIFGQAQCPAGLSWLAQYSGVGCEAHCESVALDPGTYYALVQPQEPTGISCGSEYVVELVCPDSPLCATTAARSCNMHGSSRLCLDLGSNNIEPRLTGVTSLEIDVDAGIATSATVSCINNGAYGGVATVSQAGNMVTVNLSPALPDQDACTITLDCGASVCVRTLQGDIDRNGIVSTGDASIIKPHFGQTAATAGAQFDFDQNDIVSTGDASIVKPRFGHSIPPCP